MLELQQRGCHNINLVTPTHVAPQILEALLVAAGNGLSIPLVYNTSGYDRVSTLQLLRGIIDQDEYINRRISGKEYSEALQWARDEGLERLDQRQDMRLLFRI
jgi:uncharacterized Fe-S radical SAM superfamily protein PflX